MDELRLEIDQVDDDILELLSRRFSLTDEVGIFKQQNSLEPLDSAREAKQFKRMKRLAADLDLPAGLEKDLWGIIMARVKERHAQAEAQ